MTTPFLVREDLVMSALREVFDPELGINVVDLGLLYSLEYGEGSAVVITMTLTSAACPLAEVLRLRMIAAALLCSLIGPGKTLSTFSPVSTPRTMTSAT